MIFLVNDANILIDLLKINLLDFFFRLEFDFQVTDMVFAEIREENVAELERCIELNLLTMQGFAFEDLLQIQLIEGNNPVLSIADCSCLYLAEKLSGTPYLPGMVHCAGLLSSRISRYMAFSGYLMNLLLVACLPKLRPMTNCCSLKS